MGQASIKAALLEAHDVVKLLKKKSDTADFSYQKQATLTRLTLYSPMALSVSILATVTSLHLIAFVLAIGAERRRSHVSLFLSISVFVDLKFCCFHNVD